MSPTTRVAIKIPRIQVLNFEFFKQKVTVLLLLTRRLVSQPSLLSKVKCYDHDSWLLDITEKMQKDEERESFCKVTPSVLALLKADDDVPEATVGECEMHGN